MNCSACGTELSPGTLFCGHCGVRVAPGVTVLLDRPGVLTLVAVVDFVGAAFLGLGSLVALVAAVTGEPGVRTPLTIAAALAGGLAALALVAGVGTWKLMAYGRTAQRILAGIGLLAVPFGTIISVLIFVYLARPGVAVLFSGKPPERLTPFEIAEVRKLSASSATVVVVVVVAVLAPLLVVAMIGVIAAIAIPSLLRARVSANEAAAIGDVRTVISAEATYATFNGGFFDTPECLGAPSRCLPGYKASDPVFLGSELVLASTKNGYTRHFFAGAPADAAEHVSPSSVLEFAYVAIPVTPNVTGVRSFCGESSGLIRFTFESPAPSPTDGRCPASWQAFK